jgi:site-specific recombinase XerD
MTTHSIQHTQTTSAILLDGVDNKDMISRLELYLDWLRLTPGANWRTPDLGAYRNWLMSAQRLARNRHTRILEPAPALSAASAQAHLSTIRGRYQALLESNAVRADLYSLAPEDASAADRKAFVDELLTQLENAIKPGRSKVVIINERDEADSKHLRLTIDQANALLEAPITDRQNTPLRAIRDTAIIALLLSTGIRDMELCALQVDDLRQYFGGSLALRVAKGKGSAARMVPYGALDACLISVDKWLKAASIGSGSVFRGFYSNAESVRPTGITERAIQDILNRYPINIDGALRTINPHDTRRTYARLLYEAGVSILAIQQNLGHKDHKVTEAYIGTLDSSARRPPALFKSHYLKRLESLAT